MGKFLEKGKGGAGEVETMDLPQQTSSLGVRTRAKTLALERLQKTATAAIDTSSFAYLELRSRRLERSNGRARAGRRKKPRTKRSPVPASPSRKSGSSSEVESKPCETEEGEGNSSLVRSAKEEEERGLKLDGSPEIDGGVEASFGDNAIELESGRNARESTPCSLIRDPETVRTPGSSSKRTKSIPNRRGQTAARKIIPSAQEIEDLFAKQEQEHQKVFKEKYNFDPVDDKPLPGRYEWVKIDS